MNLRSSSTSQQRRRCPLQDAEAEVRQMRLGMQRAEKDAQSRCDAADRAVAEAIHEQCTTSAQAVEAAAASEVQRRSEAALLAKRIDSMQAAQDAVAAAVRETQTHAAAEHAVLLQAEQDTCHRALQQSDHWQVWLQLWQKHSGHIFPACCEILARDLGKFLHRLHDVASAG